MWYNILVDVKSVSRPFVSTCYTASIGSLPATVHDRCAFREGTFEVPSLLGLVQIKHCDANQEEYFNLIDDENIYH